MFTVYTGVPPLHSAITTVHKVIGFVVHSLVEYFYGGVENYSKLQASGNLIHSCDGLGWSKLDYRHLSNHTMKLYQRD